MRTTTIFAETHTSERANHVAYRLVIIIIMLKLSAYFKPLAATVATGWLGSVVVRASD